MSQQAVFTPTVTVRPPTILPFSQRAGNGIVKRKTAGYARVSTDTEEQQNSYEAQVDHYTRFIKGRPEWEFVDVYTDEGISATSTKRRDGFNQMIRDALDGKIDLIITKSVSRFARNTVDSLVTIRQLKDKGVEVFFEKENIYTMDSKGELLLTIMSSLAQEESRSISENVTWGQRKRFADGKVTMPYKRFLGYRKGEDGKPEIVEEEAAVVRRMAHWFLMGMTTGAIARRLTDEKIPTPAGKTNWTSTTVESILTNEKYKGDAVLQKRFTVDFLTKKQKINEGEVPQYYVTGSHPAIIEPEVFDLIQYEMVKRKQKKSPTSCKSVLSSKLVCADCGHFFGRKAWHSGDKYARHIWRCNHKYKGGEKCKSGHLYEDALKAAFVRVLNRMLDCKDEVLGRVIREVEMVLDTADVQRECDQLAAELQTLLARVRELVDEKARTALDQDEYQRQYGKLIRRHDVIQKKLTLLDSVMLERRAHKYRLEQFVAALSDTPVTEFDEEAWCALVSRVVVHEGGKVVFEFRDGSAVEEML